ncbi:dihydroorotase [Hydromonas duriensis]|uniref:Dihydroorotase n=1 Tax=Hydromonas duriensis TaxID=1527608 RepID=A0A4V3DJR7_9BURK|nr:dihydroorotase [Hydromonas duriensis]TDR31180.1 dihydroorotase [Hydromonas duriensis]
MSSNIIIRNARLVHATHTDSTTSDIYISGDTIVGINQAPEHFTTPTTLDAGGRKASFALADLAVRLTEKGGNRRDVMHDVLSAAVAGGVAHVACLPDGDPILDEPVLIDVLCNKSAALGLAQVHVLGALTQGLNGEQLAELMTLAEHGCFAFTQADEPIQNTQILQRALSYAASFKLPVWLRATDFYLGGGFAASGAYASRLGLAGVPVTAETVALQTLFELLYSMGAQAPKVHIARISSARAVELIRHAKTQGLNITCDVNMHHLHLVDTDMGYFNNQYVFNPPLRSSSDRSALRAGVLDGTIDAVVSDHVAVDFDAKQLPVGQSQAGSVGTQWLISLLAQLATEEHVDISHTLAAAVSRAYPILGLKSPTWTAGTVADIVVFDDEAHQVLDATTVRGHHANTPYLGLELPVQVCTTLAAGRVVYTTI